LKRRGIQIVNSLFSLEAALEDFLNNRQKYVEYIDSASGLLNVNRFVKDLNIRSLLPQPNKVRWQLPPIKFEAHWNTTRLSFLDMDLSLCQMDGCNFEGSTFRNVFFNSTQQISFNACVLEHVDMSGQCDDANFSRAYLSKTDFQSGVSNSVFEQATFDKVSFSSLVNGCIFDNIEFLSLKEIKFYHTKNSTFANICLNLFTGRVGANLTNCIFRNFKANSFFLPTVMRDNDFIQSEILSFDSTHLKTFSGNTFQDSSIRQFDSSKSLNGPRLFSNLKIKASNLTLNLSGQLINEDLQGDKNTIILDSNFIGTMVCQNRGTGPCFAGEVLAYHLTNQGIQIKNSRFDRRQGPKNYPEPSRLLVFGIPVIGGLILIIFFIAVCVKYFNKQMRLDRSISRKYEPLTRALAENDAALLWELENLVIKAERHAFDEFGELKKLRLPWDLMRLIVQSTQGYNHHDYAINYFSSQGNDPSPSNFEATPRNGIKARFIRFFDTQERQSFREGTLKESWYKLKAKRPVAKNSRIFSKLVGDAVPMQEFHTLNQEMNDEDEYPSTVQTCFLLDAGSK
jgi:hypothetical protein